jgi:hypothetical protein
MEQSPFSEDNSRSASHETFRLLQYPLSTFLVQRNPSPLNLSGTAEPLPKIISWLDRIQTN